MEIYVVCGIAILLAGLGIGGLVAVFNKHELPEVGFFVVGWLSMVPITLYLCILLKMFGVFPK